MPQNQDNLKTGNHNASHALNRLFARNLRGAAVLAWVRKLLNIPVAVVIANRTADLLTEATQGHQHAVIRAGIFLLVFFLLTKLLDMFLDIHYQKLLSQDTHRCKLEVYRRLLACPLSVLHRSRHGNLVEHLNDDFNTMVGRYTSVFPGIYVGILSTAVYVGYLAVLDIRIAGILLAISLLQVIPLLIVRKYLQQNYDNCRKIEAEITDYTVEAYYGFQTMKSYALKDGWMERFRQLHRKYERIGLAATVAVRGEESMTTLMSHILTYGTCAAVGAMVLMQWVPLEVGVAAIALSKTLFGAAKGVFSAIPQLSIASKAEHRLSGILTDDGGEGKALPDASCRIDFSNVSFSYQEKEILHDMTGSLPTGGLTVIKGENGIGKSTLFRLTVGLLSPGQGRMTVGGVAPELLADDCFPFRIFYLPQDDPVYDLCAKELYQAISPEQAAEMNRLAIRFGLNDAVLERKISDCSGGERKKIYLSLALTLDPWLLLLDEPTNSLDSAGIDLLKELLSKREKGTLLITHTSCFDDLTDALYQLENGGMHRYA